MQPGWYQDPSGRFPLRWHDGTQWTPQVMDGWQRPAIDPPPPDAPPPSVVGLPSGTATTVAPPPTPRPLVPPPTRPTPAPAPAPVAPVTPALRRNRRSRAGLTKEIRAENAVAKAGVPPDRWRVTRPARYVMIVVAGVAMALGLFALPWVEVHEGESTFTYSYPKLANAVAAYHGDRLNWWQHLYLQWFAVLLAAAILAAVTATVTVVAKPPAPKWVRVVDFLVGAAVAGHALGLFPRMTHDTTTTQPSLLGPMFVLLGYAALLFACPSRPRPATRLSGRP